MTLGFPTMKLSLYSDANQGVATELQSRVIALPESSTAD